MSAGESPSRRSDLIKVPRQRPTEPRRLPAMGIISRARFGELKRVIGAPSAGKAKDKLAITATVDDIQAS
jgi:hypothetical protein